MNLTIYSHRFVIFVQEVCSAKNTPENVFFHGFDMNKKSKMASMVAILDVGPHPKSMGGVSFTPPMFIPNLKQSNIM